MRFLIFLSKLLIVLSFGYLLKPEKELKIYQSNPKNKVIEEVNQLLKNEKDDEALQLLYAFIDKTEKDKDTINIIHSKKLLADILRENGDYKKSNLIFNEIIPLIKSDYEALQYIYFKKGGNFQLDAKNDSALTNYLKAVEMGKKVAHKENLKAKIQGNLAGIYYLKENYNKAIEHSKIAANYQKILGNIEIEAGIINNLGSIYYMQGKYSEALKMFQKALNLVGEGKNELDKKTRRSAFINIAYAYSGLKNYKKAFEYQDRYIVADDSLKQELKYKEIEEISAKYKVAQKEKEAAVEKSKRIKAELLSKGLIIAAVLLLVAVYVFYKLYQLSKKNYKLQIEQQELINKGKIEKMKLDSQSKILGATLDGRLAERKKIASVLHDNISALLSAASLHLQASKSQLKESPKELSKSQDIIKQAGEQIRNLSHQLMSSILLKFGLETAVQDLSEKSSNSKLQIDSNFKNINRFNQDFEIKVYNIISELINNIIKHSGAQNAMIKLEQLEGNLKVIVFDDGKGFDVNSFAAKSGVGLSQVEARIHMLKGILNIKSTESGTRIFISLPIVY
ncbi:MAG: tetratricopeptide repeat-containing sensor histidine kinase [Lutibacter sp.]